MRAKDEDDSPDFSVEKPSSYIDEAQPSALPDQKAWEDSGAPLFGGLSPLSDSGIGRLSVRRQRPQLSGFDRRHEGCHSATRFFAS